MARTPTRQGATPSPSPSSDAVPQPSGPNATQPDVPPSRVATIALSPAPLVRMQKLHLMLAQLGARGAGTAWAMATTLPMRLEPQDLVELSAMQQAVMERLRKQHNSWIEGLTVLMHESAEQRHANTLSKYVEREYNLVAQFGALLADQASQMAGLMETIQVNLGYWVAQKQEPV
ncbi:hypothetical protein GCM10023165_36110 [Variovorax defluvii]|uniref:Phasin domain-containing protein n=1 Tax=Variovorax defluvii TaxID=913761 RepID=A0ABP8I1N0_9BURK